MGSATLAYPWAGPHRTDQSSPARVELRFLQVMRVIWTWRMTNGVRNVWSEICILAVVRLAVIKADVVRRSRHHASRIVSGDLGRRSGHSRAVSPSGEESGSALAGGIASPCANGSPTGTMVMIPSRSTKRTV